MNPDKMYELLPAATTALENAKKCDAERRKHKPTDDELSDVFYGLISRLLDLKRDYSHPGSASQELAVVLQVLDDEDKEAGHVRVVISKTVSNKNHFDLVFELVDADGSHTSVITKETTKVQVDGFPVVDETRILPVPTEDDMSAIKKWAEEYLPAVEEKLADLRDTLTWIETAIADEELNPHHVEHRRKKAEEPVATPSKKRAHLFR